MNLVGLLITFTILAGFFGLLERLSSPATNRPTIRSGLWLDISYWFFIPIIAKVVNRVIIVVIISIVAILLGIPLQELQDRSYQGFGWLGSQSPGLQTIQIFVLADLINYWVHRSFHQRSWWRIHAVHHSSISLDWLSSVRVHPANELISTLCITLPILCLGYNPFLILSYQPFLALFAIMLHAQVLWDFGFLRYVIVSPVFHRWHHSKVESAINKNFAALFAFWDILFGTYYLPKGIYPDRFGTTDPIPQHLWGQLIYPLQ